MKQDDLDFFIHWAHEAGRQNLVRCSSGNLSQRIDDESMLISGTGTWLSSIRLDEVSHTSYMHEKVYNTVAPSGEYRLHAGIMKSRPGVNTILHFQSPAATALACLETPPDYNVILEIPVYIGKVGLVPFILPGSPELADAVMTEALTCDVVQMANHGQVACGKNYREVIQKAVFFEFACSVLLNCRDNFQKIPAEFVEPLRAYRTGRN